MKKLLRTFVLAAVALAVLISLLSLGAFSRSDSAQASGTLVVGFDMDPQSTPANTCPNDGVTDCTVGSVERCVFVPITPGTTFEVDVFVTGLTNGFLAWNANIDFPDTATPAKLTLSSHVAEVNPSVNLIAQSAGSAPLSFSERAPDPPGSTEPGSPHHAAVAEMGTGEDTPPFTQGVLARYEFTVGAGATSGLYALTLHPEFVAMLDKNGTLYTIDLIGSGLLALGLDCP